jgi:hypothetical protein
MKNIFLVFTPLQILIAIKIIKFCKIEKSKAILICYGNKKNIVIKNYLKKSNYFFDKIEFIKIKKFPFYLLQISKLKKKYNLNVLNFYTTNINTIINNYFLSYFQINNIYTFDDGSGDYEVGGMNIVKDFTVFKKIIYWIFGNRYSRKKINYEKKKHFTINDYFSGHRKVYIGNLFEKIKLKKNKIKKQQKEINFYIGTVEEEYFAGMNASETEKKDYFKSTINFLKNKKNVIYLKHPRSCFNSANTFILNQDKKNCIAEEIILEYLKKNYKINIFGFYGSTVFYNLIKYKSINKYYFDFKKKHSLKKIYRNFFSKNFMKILITE